MSASSSLPSPFAGAAPAERGLPWWRFRMVWFALAGPVLVVVASFATMAIAFRHADAVIVDTPAAQKARGAHLAGANAPALQARNHAATPAP